MNRKILLAIPAVVLLAACAAEPGSERWCEEKKAQSKSEWSMEDAGTFAQHCLIDDLTIGSEAWCENLKEKPKGEWTANEAADFAKHCVM
jgi:hypothetical protein